MKTKCVGIVAGVLALCLVANADEKGKEPTVTPVDASDYKPFVVPLPKDESGFTVKPPPSGALPMSRPRQSINPKLWGLPALPAPKSSVIKPSFVRPFDSISVPQINSIPLLPEDGRSPQIIKGLQRLSEWQFRNMPLNQLLSFLDGAYNRRVVVCSSPDTSILQGDVKVSITLKKVTMEDSLEKLKGLGLLWRRLGDTYYVAWDEKDLPTPQAAIMPSPD